MQGYGIELEYFRWIKGEYYDGKSPDGVQIRKCGGAQIVIVVECWFRLTPSMGKCPGASYTRSNTKA